MEFRKGPGRKTVLFASNYPMIFPQACLSQLDVLELDEVTQRSFLHDNAKRVFDL